MKAILFLTLVFSASCSSSKYTLSEVENNPPEQPSVSISPNPAYTDDDLNANVLSPIDADGDVVSLSYQWIRNGETIEETGNRIASTMTVKNDVWRVVVTPTDGIEAGPTAEATIVIDNHPPEITNVQITPPDPSIADVLICEAFIYDPDESPTVAYTWRNLSSGVDLGIGNIVSLINAANYGDIIECQATAMDSSGAVVQESATVNVENSSPLIGALSFDPIAVYTNDMLQIVANANDPEGDTFDLRYTWSVDGMAIVNDSDTLDGQAHFEKHQLVSVEVVAEDPYSTSSPATLSTIILNSPPSAPSVAIEPNSPDAETDIICSVDIESTDADGDAIDYTTTWWKDGALWTGPTQTTHITNDTITAAETTDGEIWECEQLPNDSEADGQAGYASSEITPEPVNDCPDGNCGLRFDGVDDRVDVPYHPSLSVVSSGLTVEAWIYYDALTGPIQHCMTAVRKGISTSPTYEYWLHKNWGPADSFHWSSNTGWTISSFGAAYSGGWIHYAGVADFSSGEARTYINGNLHSSGVANFPTTNTEDVIIGIDWDGGCAMYGVLDEIRISSVVRYAGNFSPSIYFTPDADTMALYHFDENSGSIAHDSSGNGNHGAITGAQWTTESP